MKDQIRIATLEECGVEMFGGQIMSRLTVCKSPDDEIAAVRKVVVPKCIHPDGSINVDEMAEEQLYTDADAKRVTEPGDIVMKLSTPYDAARVTEESAGSVVPSFCVIIKKFGKVYPDYLLAFLNSSTCKNQIKVLVAGAAMAMLSVGKVKGIRIPVPDEQEQHRIGESFLETQNKVYIMEQIIRLEQKKNNVYFRDLVKQNGK